jgi:hypothetical protein
MCGKGRTWTGVTGIMTLPTGTVYISGGRSSIVGPPLASVTIACINICRRNTTHRHVRSPIRTSYTFLENLLPVKCAVSTTTTVPCA